MPTAQGLLAVLDCSICEQLVELVVLVQEPATIQTWQCCFVLMGAPVHGTTLHNTPPLNISEVCTQPS